VTRRTVQLRERACKPGSVKGDHLSTRARRRAALAALPGRSAGSFISPLFSLAPGGVCQASASRRSWWSLTPPFQLSRDQPGVFFSVALSLSQLAGQLPLATTLPCGARTFLPDCSGRSPGSLHYMVAPEARGYKLALSPETVQFGAIVIPTEVEHAALSPRHKLQSRLLDSAGTAFGITELPKLWECALA